MGNQASWQEITKKYPQFIFDRYHYNLVDGNLVIAYDFALPPDKTFSHKITIKDVDTARFGILPKKVIDNLVFNIGIIESFSYWKAAASPTITINAGFLNEEQIAWWKDLLLNGMGEYIFRNDITIDHVRNVRIESKSGNQDKQIFDGELTKRAIVPIGGGKDSIVTAKLLKNADMHVAGLVVDTFAPITSAHVIATKLFGEKQVTINRQIDPALLKLNGQGYLNGHTPFSASLAFIAVLCAVIFDYQDIVLSNEFSANEADIVYQGQAINHQYSKSFVFEKRFHDYARNYLASHVNYFSFLRPAYELQIAQIFSEFKDYFSLFKSCNVGQKSNTWCGKCAKCLFVYLILYPFMEGNDLKEIFGQDLFKAETLLPLLKELVGVAEHKPFECVGTYEEVRAALYLSTQKTEGDQVLLQYFTDEILSKYPNIKTETNKVLTNWNDENLLSGEYKQLLQKQIAIV